MNQNLTQEWLNLIVNDPTRFFIKVEQKELSLAKLNPDEMNMVIGLVNVNGTLHKLADKKNWTALKNLVELGADVMVSDSEGNCLLTKINDADLFELLIDKQPLPDKYSSSLITHLNSKMIRPLSESAQWKGLYLKVLAVASLDDLIKSRPLLYPIFQNDWKDPDFINALLKKLSSLAPTNPCEKFYKLMLNLFEYANAKKLVPSAFKFLLEQRVLPDWVVVEFLSEHTKFLEIAQNNWKAGHEIVALFERFGRLDMVIAYQAVLQSTYVYQAAAALDQLVFLDAEVRLLNRDEQQVCIDTVIKLQNTEDAIIWEYSWEFCNNSKGLVNLINFGLNPNWVNPKTKRGLLFTPMAKNFVTETGCNINSTDRRGDNALEHHCRNTQPLKPLGSFFQSVLGYSRCPNPELCSNLVYGKIN